MDVQVSNPPPPPPPPPPPFFAETTTSQLIVPPPPPPPPPAFLQQPVTTITTTVTASVASPASQDRVWLHPWTVTEMRDNASQWSLAGDAGLLLYLEQFSDKLVQRADAIQQHLSQTVNAVKSTHTRVQNCLNEFTSLANTQFIENRVYDEDETAIAAASKKDEASTEKTNVSNTEAQEKVLQRYVEAVQYGLAILETHFERVDPKFDTMQNGDASYVDDDEDGGIPIEPILEPKDPYIYRPLPYLIGTTEFMEDDYVGLGDLLNVPDKDDYGVAEPKELDTDSAVSSSDQEDDDDFEVEVSPAPIVPAGASRPDIANQLRQPVASMPSDSDDDDDPFGLNTGPTFADFSSRKPVTANILSEKPIVPMKPKQDDFDEGSDNDEDDMFGTISKKPPPVVETNNNNTFDNEPSASQESDESEEHKHVGGVSMFGGAQKNMSELEKAVLRRRKAMGDPDVQLDDEEDVVKKTTKTSNETISAAVIKTKIKPSTETPSSSTISNLASQPLTKPVPTTEKISKQTIFGGRSPSDDDDEIDFFNDAPKPKPLATVISPQITTTTTTKIETKPAPPIISGKKEKDLLDPDTDEDDNPFAFRRDNVSSSLQKKQNDSNPKIPPTIVNKPPPVIKHDDSDDDGLFSPTKPTAKPIPTASTTNETKKLKSASSDDDIFNALTNTKPQQTPAKPKTSEDKNPPLASKQPVRQEPVALVAPSSLITPSFKKPNVTVEEDSDDEIFGISKPRSKASATVVPTAVLSAKAADEDNVVGVTTTRPKVPITEAPKIIPVKSDDDDELFSFEQPQIKLPPPVVLPPLPSPPSVKSDDYEDPLFGTRKSIETTVQLPAAVPVKIPPASVVQPTKKVLSDSEDEDITPKRELNKAALKEGEKPNVGRLASLLNINPTAHKPGARPKAPLNTDVPAKPSADLDEPVVPVVKTLPKVDSDSDDDLFNNRKKPTPLVSTDQQKEKASEENASGKVTVKALSSLIKINPMAHTPNAQPKPTANKENGSDDLTQTSATEVSKEEPTAEKTMLNILKDRAKVSVKNRTPPTRKPRSGGATATTATNDTDDFFALPSSTNTTAASSSPLPPPPTVVIPVIPPPVPVTGLLDNTAATAAPLSDQQAKSKEKKKILHFDSDDSDIDELLFGSSKKTKSPAETKPPPTITTTLSTTTKTKPKASILSLDDDDDFLAKRPIKKNAKALDNDDIFADVKSKSQQSTKAKKDWSIMNKSETDDIFTDTSAKSSNAAKSKSTNVKNKSVKDLDDIFDDPLNVTSKR